MNFNLDVTKEENMTLSQIYRTALIAFAGFLLTAVFHTGAVAQANSPQGVRNIVIVHGAWVYGVASLPLGTPVELELIFEVSA